MSRAIVEPTAVDATTRPLDAEAVWREHASFVWCTLQRLGVRVLADRDDLFQEVFLVVHRALHKYRGDGAITAWLFGICIRVVRAHRRRAYRIYEDVGDEGIASTAAVDGPGPEEIVARREAQRRLDEVLDGMDLERRAIFVMYEIDEMTCEEIAACLGVPVGTVHSRLHAARKDFERSLARWKARNERVVLR